MALPENAVAGTKLPFALTLENRGVAPPYQPYELCVKLTGAGGSWTHTATKAGKSWLPGAPIALHAEILLPAQLKPGEYELSVGLFDAASGKERAVEFALKATSRDAEGFYRVASLPVSKATSTK